MKNNRKHIDDLFREKLGGYSEVPPAEAWGDLDKKLDTLVPHIPSSNPFRWLGHVGIVSVIAVLSVSLVQKFMGNNSNDQDIVKEQVINKLENTNSSLAINNTTSEVAETNVPPMDNGNDNSEDNSQSNGNTIAAVSGGQSNGDYTDNAGEEYVEGVTRINREQAYSGNTPGSDLAGFSNIQGNLGNIENEAYNTGRNSGISETKAVDNVYNNSVNQLSANKKINPDLAVKNSKRPLTTSAKSGSFVKTHRNSDLIRWEAGVKGGYERGFDNNGATKYVIAPYLQYNISDNFAVMIQPAVKYANNPVRTIGTARSYYKANPDAAVADRGTSSTIIAEGSSVYTYYHTKLRYSQTYDSIVKTERTAAHYMEYELPVMIKYNISKKASVYGGVNMVYSQMNGVSEYTYTKTSITKIIDTIISAKSVMPVAPATDDILTFSGSPLSEYNGPLYPATQVNQLRFGATLGFSYEYSDRWLLDALVQQNPAKKDMRAGYNINAPLSSPYFRLSVGYKLTK